MDVTLPIIISAALLDSINPCAIAVLIFLLTYLMHVSKDRRRMVKTGIIYVAAVFITYLLAGLGILSFIHSLGSGPTLIIKYIAAAIAILFGIINLVDFFSKRQEFFLKIPDSAKPLLEKYIHKANIPAAIVLGFLVAVFELPCTGAVYFSILALLAQSSSYLLGFIYLAVYNLVFVLPLLAIILLVDFGMRAEQIENWRQAERKWMKLIMALLLLTLGTLMVTGFI